MKGSIGCIFYVGYMALGLFQLAAVMAGLHEWWGIPKVVAALIGFIVAYLPVIGTITGIVGAHDAWRWSWEMSIALFLGPMIVMFSIAGVAALLDRRG